MCPGTVRWFSLRHEFPNKNIWGPAPMGPGPVIPSQWAPVPWFRAQGPGPGVGPRDPEPMGSGPVVMTPCSPGPGSRETDPRVRLMGMMGVMMGVMWVRGVVVVGVRRVVVGVVWTPWYRARCGGVVLGVVERVVLRPCARAHCGGVVDGFEPMDLGSWARDFTHAPTAPPRKPTQQPP